MTAEHDGAAAFEEFAAILDYPMYVVTTASGGTLAGCLLGFATQVSIDPARFLLAVSNKNRTFRVAATAERIAVHVLAADNRDLAELFGEETGDRSDKFARCAWHPGPGGVPVLEEAAAWFSGRVLERLELGDHVGFLLEPEAGGIRDEQADLLTFTAVRNLDPGHGA